MKVVGLLSGGKDSCYNLCHAAKQGHEIVALATLAPPEGKDELDSYMYQTVGHDAVHLVAEAMDLPLYRRVIAGQPLRTGNDFTTEDFHQDDSAAASSSTAAVDETSDLFLLLQMVKRHHPDVQGVSVGAILSNYQRFRVESVCMHPALQLQPLAYLWQRTDQAALLDEMIAAGLHAVLIKVAGAGLTGEEHLGKSLSQMRTTLRRLEKMYGAHVCGEGGEYETLTLDCPLFKRRIRLVETESVVHDESGEVAYLRVKRAVLEDKGEGEEKGLEGVAVPPILDGMGQRTLRAAQRGMKAARESSGLDGSNQWPSIPPSSSGVSSLQSRIKPRGPWLSFSVPPSPASQAFSALTSLLASENVPLAGTVQHINLGLSSQSHFLEVNKLYKTTFSALEPPSRATVALPSLSSAPSSSHEGPVISLDGIAYHPQANSNSTASRQCLHVQSLSYWSAANIGPYSQAVSVASRISAAGQIGLRPVDLALPDTEVGTAQQVALSLQHARRILAALGEERCRSVGKGWVEGGVVWISGDDQDGVLDAAREAWGAQAVQEDLDDDQEEDACSSWLLGTEGVQVVRSGASTISAQPHDLPLLYAKLRPGDLPRAAAVEWQLTAHDGRRSAVVGDDDDDDGDGEAQRPTITVDEVEGVPSELLLGAGSGSNTVTVQSRSINSRDGASHFGIMVLRFEQDKGRASTGEQHSALINELHERLRNPATLSVRLFVDASATPAEEVQSMAQGLLASMLGEGQGTATTSIVPTLGLWTTGRASGQSSAPLQRWQAAFVWHAVE